MPLVRSIALKLRLVDKPDKRKQHKNSIVRLGGIAIFLGIYISFLILFSLGFLEIESNSLFWPIFNFAPLFFLLGFVDDIINLSPFIRLCLQVVISIFLWLGGIQINLIDFQFFQYFNFSFYLIDQISLIFTILWIVGIINAINWADGLDGLATGIISISIIGLIFNSIFLGNYEACIFLLSILGVCLSFLIFNLYPAKILMGDGGSYLLGFLASTLSIYSLTPENQLNQGLTFSSLNILFLFAIPIFDMALVILSRMKSNKSIFLPDRNHIHYRILDSGFTHKETVFLILAFSQFFVCLSLIQNFNNYLSFILLISLSILVILIFNKCDINQMTKLKLSPKKDRFF